MPLNDVELALVGTIRRSLEELHLEKEEVEELLEKVRTLAEKGKEKRNSAKKEEGERIVSAADADEELKQQIRALLSSESGYIAKLDQIVTDYLIPLRVGSDSVKMKTQATIDIFSNVDILASIHHEFHNNLSACFEKFPLIPIGELFLKTVPSLELYTQFVNNFSNAINTLHIEDKRSKSFHQFLSAKEEKNGMGLEALLSVPLNRVAHYRAIFTNIFALTARNSPDYKNMVEIMESLETLQEQINKSLTQSHSMAKIIAVEQRVQGRENVSLRDFNREFIHEGALAVADSDGKKVKDKEAYFFLFNDILVYTKRLQQKNLCKYKKTIKLQHAKLSHEGTRISLKLRDDDTPSLTLVADNEVDKLEWVTSMDIVIRSMEETKVYEVPLETLVERETESLIPSFIESLIKRIEEAAFETPGIFRVSASKNALNSVKALVDRGIHVEVAFLDDHVVSGLLKEFFRFLPEPVIPFAFYDRLMDCAGAADPVASLKDLVEAMPAANAALLKRLMSCLVKVASKSTVNMMGTSNLAIVIGPNLARPADDPMAEIGFSASGAPLIEKMITQYDDIFPRDARTFAKAMPKSMVYSKDKSTITTAAGPLLGGTRQGRRGSPEAPPPASPAAAASPGNGGQATTMRGGFNPSMIAAAALRMKQGSSAKPADLPLPRDASPSAGPNLPKAEPFKQVTAPDSRSCTPLLSASRSNSSSGIGAARAAPLSASRSTPPPVAARSPSTEAVPPAGAGDAPVADSAAPPPIAPRPATPDIAPPPVAPRPASAADSTPPPTAPRSSTSDLKPPPTLPRPSTPTPGDATPPDAAPPARLPSVVTAATTRPATPGLVKPKQVRAKPPATRGPPPPATRGPPPPAARSQPPRQPAAASRPSTPASLSGLAPPPSAGPAPSTAVLPPAVTAPALVDPLPGVAGPPPAVTGPPPAVTGPPPAVTGPPPAVAGPPPSGVAGGVVAVAADACAECGTTVGSDCLRLFGKQWHIACFKCSICGEAFDQDSYVLEINGNPVCKADYDRAHMKKCARCDQAVIDDYVDVMDNLYHVACFTCSHCSAPLTGGFFKRQGQAVCKACKNLVPK